MDDTASVEINELELLEQLSRFTREEDQYLNKQFIQVRDHEPVLNYLDMVDKGTLLDIGSYSGNFLDAARSRGWDVTGLEPLIVPAMFSEKEFGLKIIKKTLDKSGLPAGSFKIITAFHVIEHIYNPEDFINQIRSLLNKDGIMILETPTYDSWTFKLLRHRERSIRCNGHIYFFTKNSLKSLVEKCGFSVVRHDRVGRTLTLDRLFTNFGIMMGNRDVFNKISKWLGLEKRYLHLNVGDMQRIYCRKIS